MIFDKPIAPEEVVAYLRQQKLIPSNMTAAQWEKIPAELRRQAFFSARQTNADFLQTASDLIERIANPAGEGSPAAGSYMDVPRFREELKNYLTAIGYSPEPGKEGTIEDLRSDPRLNLIAKTNVQIAQGFGQHIQANDPDVLDAFPAQELFRLEDREKPREWTARWREAGGHFFDLRMIALKDDPVWEKLSRWENPYPPFDYNSGMWTRPISRKEALQLGVLADATYNVMPSKVGFAEGLQGNVSGLSKALQAALVKSSGATLDGDTITLSGED